MRGCGSREVWQNVMLLLIRQFLPLAPCDPINTNNGADKVLITWFMSQIFAALQRWRGLCAYMCCSSTWNSLTWFTHLRWDTVYGLSHACCLASETDPEQDSNPRPTNLETNALTLSHTTSPPAPLRCHSIKWHPYMCRQWRSLSTSLTAG